MKYYDLLYDFQREDVDKLGLSGNLDASDMGSGKTIKGVAHDERYNPDSRTLVVCPLAVVQHWRQHFIRAGLPVVVCDPHARDDSFERFVKYDNKIFVTHWESLQKRLGLLNKLQTVRWGEIIADEIQFMQNRKSQQALGLKSLRTDRKLALSGTPATTNIDGYWSPLNWLYPVTKKGGFGSYWTFRKNYVETEVGYTGYEKIIGPKNEDQLLAKIDPYYVRHMKRDPCCSNHPQGVMPWLKDKYYTTIEVELPDKIRRAYESMRKEMVAWVGDCENDPVIAQNFIARLTRLNQFTGAYAQVNEADQVLLSEPSPKLDAAQAIISRSRQPIVVFSMYRQMIELLHLRLTKAGISNGMYTGQNRSTREQVKEAFVDGQLQVLGLTIGAGGVGLDGLQQVSDTGIFLDRDWSPSRNVQSEDRLWRDGQDNTVHIIDIVALNTIELGRRQGIEEKWSWLKRLLGDSRKLQQEALDV